jgi:hypothetical protein
MLILRKSEASIEFVVLIGILLLFFVFFIGITGVNNRDISESTVFANARNILDTVTNEINTASRIEGYYREFFLPERLSNGEVYYITIYTNLRMVKIEWSNKKNIMSNIVTENVMGSVNPGVNVIKNEKGIVKINEG